MQKKISAKLLEHNIEIINAGTPKAYSFTESNLIKNKLLEYDPDLLSNAEQEQLRQYLKESGDE